MRRERLLQKDSRRQLRNGLWRKATALICVLVLLLPAAASIQAQPKSASALLYNQSAPLTDAQVNQRVNALLAQMTLEEKIGQLTQLFFGLIPDTVKPEDRIRKGEVGSLLFVTDPA